MTEKQFLMWLPHAQAWLKRHLTTERRVGLELRPIGLPGSGSRRYMIQTPSFVTRFDPLTAVASLVGPRSFYDVSRWDQGAKDLRLSPRFAGRLFCTIYQEDSEFYDVVLREKLIAAIS